ncbi:GP180-like protein [Mya arenaria]|uniref:GP180-like protein n=1 Tax=Mya arenaria TaxID=6604 RepID=A0ABY7G320_MYAAR|nr:GP180-like protein [Mya arenaria]
MYVTLLLISVSEIVLFSLVRDDLTAEIGNKTIANFQTPRVWYVIFADEYTCSDVPMATLDMSGLNFVYYDIQLLNPDALGNPTEHFSLLRFYQLLALAYFILGCICIPRLIEPLNSRGPMQLVIQLLSVSTGLQAVGAFIMMIHLRKHVSSIADIQETASDPLCLKCYLNGGLFLYEQYQDQTNRLYHAHRTLAGSALLVLRVVLAVLFGWNLYTTVSLERNDYDERGAMSVCCSGYVIPIVSVPKFILGSVSTIKYTATTYRQIARLEDILVTACDIPRNSCSQILHVEFYVHFHCGCKTHDSNLIS